DTTMPPRCRSRIVDRAAPTVGHGRSPRGPGVDHLTVDVGNDGADVRRSVEDPGQTAVARVQGKGRRTVTRGTAKDEPVTVEECVAIEALERSLRRTGGLHDPHRLARGRVERDHAII